MERHPVHEYYDALKKAGDKENDMLDMAFELVDTSRLGCQARSKEGLDRTACMLSVVTTNRFVGSEFGGFSPHPHPS